MYAYELLPKLIFLTLTANNTAEHWEEKLEFVGTENQWLASEELTAQLCLG